MQLTEEFFQSVGITITQPAKGHRYGEESIDLAKFCKALPKDRVCEFGSGSGVISIYLAARWRPFSITGVEIQKELFEIAGANLLKNDLKSRVRFINADYRNFANETPGSFEHVVVNPPFYAQGSGRKSSCQQRLLARHEIHGSLAQLLQSAQKVLTPDGMLWMIFLNSRKDELLAKSFDAGFRLEKTAPSSNSTFLTAFSFHGPVKRP
jgi:tRNA1Val (adenine37-N6)-methyltransferase